MKRMFFKDRGRRKTEAMDLDITSLLDVLVILLVFLLKSYNASDLKLNLVDNLTIPDSDARKLGNHTVIVQVDKDKKIFVNDKEIGLMVSHRENPILLEELKKIREQKRAPASATGEKAKEDKTINLVFDKSLPYKVMKGVMHTSATAGFTEFKFIVKGNY